MTFFGSLRANLRRLFLEAEVVTFESALDVTALEDGIRAAMAHGWGVQALVGTVSDGQARLNWSHYPLRYPNGAVFKARIETMPAGSRITGRMEISVVNHCLASMWLGLVLVFSLVFVWTVFIPLAGLGLLWVGAWMFTAGDAKTERNICRLLARLCEAPPTLAEKHATAAHVLQL